MPIIEYLDNGGVAITWFAGVDIGCSDLKANTATTGEPTTRADATTCIMAAPFDIEPPSFFDCGVDLSTALALARFEETAHGVNYIRLVGGGLFISPS